MTSAGGAGRSAQARRQAAKGGATGLRCAHHHRDRRRSAGREVTCSSSAASRRGEPVTLRPTVPPNRQCLLTLPGRRCPRRKACDPRRHVGSSPDFRSSAERQADLVALRTGSFSQLARALQAVPRTAQPRRDRTLHAELRRRSGPREDSDPATSFIVRDHLGIVWVRHQLADDPARADRDH